MSQDANHRPAADEAANPHRRSNVGETTDDAFGMQFGTDECFWCKRRLSPAEIAACEEPDGIGRCER